MTGEQDRSLATARPEWRDEAVRRFREIDEGLVGLIPAEKVLERAYAALK
jgi:hypothetical protein